MFDQDRSNCIDAEGGRKVQNAKTRLSLINMKTRCWDHGIFDSEYYIPKSSEE
jgi:hypothetical protein